MASRCWTSSKVAFVDVHVDDLCSVEHSCPPPPCGQGIVRVGGVDDAAHSVIAGWLGVSMSDDVLEPHRLITRLPSITVTS